MSDYLQLESLTLNYGKTVAVDSLSLSIAQGELVAFLGPSGCGKSTTMRAIAGLMKTRSGRIRLDGKDITRKSPNKRDVGMVFQSYALFPHLNVTENVAFGLRLKGLADLDVAMRVNDGLSMVGLTEFAQRMPAELSGGQQQRVALARALVMDPKVLLLDEPLSNLDARLRLEMRSELQRVQKKTGLTMIFVTHDQVEALSLADRIVVMNRGCVEQIGTPEEIYNTPATRFVADFVGFENIIPINSPLSLTGSLPADVQGLAWRPASVVMGSGPYSGKIMGNAFAGTVREYLLETAFGPIRADVAPELPAYQSGSQIAFDLPLYMAVQLTNMKQDPAIEQAIAASDAEAQTVAAPGATSPETSAPMAAIAPTSTTNPVSTTLNATMSELTEPKLNLWVDTDMGFDDMHALLVLRHQGVRPAGQSLVFGCTPLPQVLNNAMSFDSTFNWYGSWHAGASASYDGIIRTAEHVLGWSGMLTRGAMLPQGPLMPYAADSTAAMIDWLSTNPEQPEILAMGPLTNIAQLVQQAPELAARITRLTWMGGSTGQGNQTAYGEFNAWADAKAASIVFASGIPIQMVDLEVCRQVQLQPDDLIPLTDPDLPMGPLLHDLLGGYLDIGLSRGRSGMAVYDPVAAAAIVASDDFESRPVNILIETLDSDREGQTIISDAIAGQSLHTVLTLKNASRVKSMLMEALLSAAKNEGWQG
ncbi:nucleoside hydrolase [Granulosicoccus antarcticus]|uniref:sn-glycerol-3-phosphate import ATP-binding protein UgpC n=1 Tax=Granulosicoccus antarcticus IMCC3135 TaxID=1192854 RepID=A0A2Z2P192_9GAMM|nr:nucleoside hydrolase [Granulosicoccus antarcticus]ASJ74177.1 sn-glycerol-3-phosphate import ATP-binding protein UgpC [Granulosicoccus antarcticus IMCC3135]